MPRVTVIIPTHNRSELLRCAISSVLSQTFEDFELCVIDDASSDDTEKVVGSFRDQRIRYLRHPTSKGGAAARNTGILSSTSDYLAFLDDDDEWYPEKLRMQVELLDRGPASVGVIYAGYDSVEGTTGRQVRSRIPIVRGNLHEHLLTSNPIGGTSTVLIRRECLEAVGSFDEALTSYQDYDLWLRISERYEFDFIPQALLKYTLHEVRISTNLDARSTGINRILQKHGRHPSLCKTLATHCVGLGREYALAGEGRKARQMLRRAMMLHPGHARTYLYYLVSLFGRSGFEGLTWVKSRMTASPGTELDVAG